MAAPDLAARIGSTRAACQALGVPRASFYRHRKPSPASPADKVRPRPPLALSESEVNAVLEVLHNDRFVDCAPSAVQATLLEEGTYHCSIRTMYRILDRHGEVKERRNQLSRPPAAKPELLATAPNQVWSWDITKLKGPAKWTYFYLYVVLDIFSRYVVGWLLADRECAAHAQRLIRTACDNQAIQPGQLTVHADRGAPMRGKAVAQLLADLGVTKTHSRPYTSNDNPFIEAFFKTGKYRPDFPDRFGGREDALSFCRRLFSWYNTEHQHSGIAFLTPEDVHYDRAPRILARRQAALDQGFLLHPERFKGRRPLVSPLPSAVWINPPPLDRDGQPRPQSAKTDLRIGPTIDAIDQAIATPRNHHLAATSSPDGETTEPLRH